jgi:hypothetical protein
MPSAPYPRLRVFLLFALCPVAGALLFNPCVLIMSIAAADFHEQNKLSAAFFFLITPIGWFIVMHAFGLV